MENNIKEKIMSEIEKHSDVFNRVSLIQYVIRCPICGDSQKNLKKARCYLKCSLDPTEPILYHCFNCDSSGVVNGDFLKRLGINNSEITSKLENQKYNKIGVFKKNNVDIITGDVIMNSPQIHYIERRLGKGLTKNDYNRFKIIWDINNITEFIIDKKILNSMPTNKDSISFLSDNKSMILNRSLLDDGSWRKIKIFNFDGRSFYTIKSTIDLFTSEDITINITEGIFDILSVYKNFNSENSVFIAVLGSDYLSGVNYAISKGFIGDNVVIKIYMDSDVDDNAVRFLKNQLKNMRWIFKKIFIYKNAEYYKDKKYKDMGTTIDHIDLIEKEI